MSATVLRFPPRGIYAHAVRVERETGSNGWLTLADACGSLHGDFASALREAHEIAVSCGVVVVSSASGSTNSRFPMRNVNRLHACSRPETALATKEKVMLDEIDDLYGSKYLTTSHLNGQKIRLRIREVTAEDLREQDGRTKRKLVVYFENEEKPLPLNKTNVTRLALAFGRDRKKWAGKVVELYSEMTSNGKEGVRLQCLQQKPAQPVPEPEEDYIPV
jgi:hypothetical protein